MSGIMDAVGRGLSRMGGAAADLYARSFLADEEAARQERLLEFKQKLEMEGEQRKVKIADDQRVSKASRINAKADEMLGAENEGLMSAKSARVDAGIADRSSWTPDQQAAVDQSMQLDRDALKTRKPDGLTMTRAAVATGDEQPAKLAEIERKGDADINRLLMADGRNQTALMIAAGREDTRKLVAGIAAAAKSSGGGKDQLLSAGITTLNDARKSIDNDIRELRTEYLAKRKDASPKDQKALDAKHESDIEPLRARKAQVEKGLDSLMTSISEKSQDGKGVKIAPPAPLPPAAPKPAPAASGLMGAPKPKSRPPLSSFLKG
jgi:hypothetical protein